MRTNIITGIYRTPPRGDLRIGNIHNSSVGQVSLSHEMKRRLERLIDRRGHQMSRSHRFELSGEIVRIDFPSAPFLMDFRLVEHSRYFGKHTVNVYNSSVASILNLDASMRDQRGFCTDLMERVYSFTYLRDRLHLLVDELGQKLNDEIRVDVLTSRDLADAYDSTQWVPGKRQIGQNRLTYIIAGPLSVNEPPQLILEQCNSMRPIVPIQWQVMNAKGTYWVAEVITASLFDRSDKSVIWARYGPDYVKRDVVSPEQSNCFNDIGPANQYIREGNPFFESDLEWLPDSNLFNVHHSGRCELAYTRR
jgi:hypothetical protein